MVRTGFRGRICHTEIRESDVSVSPQAVEKDDGQHILIAYFTWAENTHVENPDEIDVDATTSASVLPPGNAAELAGWIRYYWLERFIEL